MKILLSGGGTAGHVYPALATADELRARGHEILFVGTPDSFEEKLVPASGFAFVGLEAAGFKRRHPQTLITSTAKIVRSTGRAKQLFAHDRPDVVVGFGGYVCIPVGRAAHSCKIPLVVHEQNSVPGLANKYLSRFAESVGVTYPVSKGYFSRTKQIEVVGNPVRSELLRGSKENGREAFSLPQDATVLLIFGGSRGARHINEASVSLAAGLLAADPNLHVIHVTGENELDAVRGKLREQGVGEGSRWHTFGYTDRMPDALHAADLVVSRSGATSLAEITALGKPAVLIPYPYATGDHQTKNAQACVDAGAAIRIADDELRGDRLGEVLQKLLGDAHTRATMASASLSLGRPDAASALADLIERAARLQQPIR